MINIRRGPCPDSLSSGKTIKQNDYSNQDVKKELLNMQYHKCCWCEKDMRKLGQKEKWVEHLEPQTSKIFKEKGKTNWNKANAWTNLLYACSTCNGSKGTEPMFHPKTKKRWLINPSYLYVDPERHITFKVDGPIIAYKAKKNSSLGKRVIKELKLAKRTDLYGLMRPIKSEINNSIDKLVDAVENNDQIEYEKIADELKRITCATSPHAAFIRVMVGNEIDEFNTKFLPQLNTKYRYCFNPVNITLAKKAEKIT